MGKNTELENRVDNFIKEWNTNHNDWIYKNDLFYQDHNTIIVVFTREHSHANVTSFHSMIYLFTPEKEKRVYFENYGRAFYEKLEEDIAISTIISTEIKGAKIGITTKTKNGKTKVITVPNLV